MLEFCGVGGVGTGVGVGGVTGVCAATLLKAGESAVVILALETGVPTDGVGVIGGVGVAGLATGVLGCAIGVATTAGAGVAATAGGGELGAVGAGVLVTGVGVVVGEGEGVTGLATGVDSIGVAGDDGAGVGVTGGADGVAGLALTAGVLGLTLSFVFLSFRSSLFKITSFLIRFLYLS